MSTSISSFTYSLLFWLTQCVQEHTSMHNSPASRQEHFLTSTHSLYVQYRLVRSRTSSGADCVLSEWRVHRRKLTSYEQLVQSALSLRCGFCTKPSMTFGMNDMLFEGIFGWGKDCCWFVCCHDHSVAQLIECIDVSALLTIMRAMHCCVLYWHCRLGYTYTHGLFSKLIACPYL